MLTPPLTVTPFNSAILPLSTSTPGCASRSKTSPGGREVTRRSTEEGIGGSAIAAKIRNVLTFYRPLADVAGVEVRQHRTTLYNSIYRFDADMLVNTHIYGYNAATAPVLHLRRLSGGTLFDTYADSFEKVWTASKPVNW